MMSRTAMTIAITIARGSILLRIVPMTPSAVNKKGG